MEELSRLETLLKAMVNGEKVDLVPQSRAEVYLKQLCEQGVGGGSVQPDWNEEDETSPAYIQNKPDLSSSGGGVTWFTFNLFNISSGYQMATESTVLSRGRKGTSNNKVGDVLEVLNAFDNGIVHFQIYTTNSTWSSSVATMLGYSLHSNGNIIYEISFSYVDASGSLIVSQMCIKGDTIHEPLKVSTSTTTTTTTTTSSQ